MNGSPVMVRKQEGDSSGFKTPPPKPVYFGDIDEVLRKVAENVPIADSERIYLWELDTQSRVYLAVIVLSLIMGGFAVLLYIIPLGVGG